MARVTVEDCVDKVPNRFELVLLAAQRARAISSGVSLTVERDNDKNPVVALREIADETIKAKDLYEAVITGMQKHVEVDEPEEDDLSFVEVSRTLQQSHDVAAENLAKALSEFKAKEGSTEAGTTSAAGKAETAARASASPETAPAPDGEPTK